MSPPDRVAMWLDYISSHDGALDFAGRMFYIWAHPRKDQAPPAGAKHFAIRSFDDSSNRSEMSTVTQARE